MARGNYKPVHTVHGYDLRMVVSALQKSIRRGDENLAVWWATEMYKSGFGEYCWSRLKVILSEDIGLADPYLPATFRALYENWLDMKKKPGTVDFLTLTHAVLLMARSPKSAVVVKATAWSMDYMEHQDELPEFPDYVYDRHTPQGRRMGRGWVHFLEEGGLLENMDPSVDNPDFDHAWIEVLMNNDDPSRLGPKKYPADSIGQKMGRSEEAKRNKAIEDAMDVLEEAGVEPAEQKNLFDM